jgi:apolipoprotein N-acyltransferase
LKSISYSRFYPVIAALGSGALLVFSFPDLNQGWLAWVALVPLLLAILKRKSKYAFILSLLSGVVCFGFTFSWMFEVEGYKFFHHAILHLYLGCYFGLFGLAFGFLGRRLGPTSALAAAPFIWVSLEYVRSNMGFISYPSTLLAHSQYAYAPIIQAASIAGAYGISFLIMMVNSALALVIMPLVHRMQESKQLPYETVSKRARISLIAGTAILMIIVLVYGVLTIAKPIDGSGIKVSIVQGNIKQSEKWDPKHADYIMQTYSTLSQEVSSKDEPALIIWPEAATPGLVLKRLGLYDQMAGIVKNADTYFLIGSSEFPKYEKHPQKDDKTGNTALFFSPEGKVLAQYLKIRLLPFSEYLPMKESIPWSYLQVPTIGSHIRGREYVLFKGPDYRFGATICWETIFPDLIRQFVKTGAQFIVNLTNEAWFGKSAAPYQFLSINVFRAVENRRFLVRCGNTGVSCFIDPYGRVVDRVKDATGKDIFVQGVLTETVVPMDFKTIYTRYGEWIVWLSFLVTAAFLLVALLMKKRPHNSG